MYIEHLNLFIRLASTNNITLAGKDLGLSPAVASGYLNKLEESLGVRLLHRTTRKLSLTEEGVAFLPHAEEVLASVEAARASVGAGAEIPQGTLRVTAPSSFGRMHLVPGLKSFFAHYPELRVDMHLTDAIVDLVEGGLDIAIRNAELKSSSLIARKLAPDKRIICASPQYLKEYGKPQTPQDLRNHKCITLMGLETWTFATKQGQQSIKVSGNLRTDNGEAVRDCCADGLGVTMSSTWSVYKHLQRGDLIQILEDYPLLSGTAIWAVYPTSRLLAPKVRVFIDFFSHFFGHPPYWNP